MTQSKDSWIVKCKDHFQLNIAEQYNSNTESSFIMLPVYNSNTEGH